MSAIGVTVSRGTNKRRRPVTLGATTKTKKRIVCAPDSVRSLLDAFSKFDTKETLGEFFDRMDWDLVSSHQIYATFLGRLPESSSALKLHQRFPVREQAINFFCSPEFQSRIIELILQAYPDKRRLFHIHVPKSAGVDLRDLLVRTYPFVHYNHTRRESTSPLDLAKHLNAFAELNNRSDSILITGHTALRGYLDRGLIRHSDAVFTVLRHPKDSIISLVNYYLRRICEDPHCEWPDTKSYAQSLGVEGFPRNLSLADQIKVGIAILHNEDMMRPNLLVHMLGCGTADSAMDAIICANVELVPLHSYKEWLTLRWGIESDSQKNKSTQVFHAGHLSKEIMEYLDNLLSESVKLYDTLMLNLRKPGTVSIMGKDLL